MSWDAESTVFYVIKNHKEQYSIWPDHKTLPDDWQKEGKSGPRLECLKYINEIWSNMQPKNLRNFLENNKDTATV